MAAGVGINLQVSSNVVLAELSWTDAEQTQAIDRVHRIGQAEPVTAWRIIASQTIDTKIAELIDSKAGLSARALDGSDEEVCSSVDIQLEALVALLTEALEEREGSADRPLDRVRATGARGRRALTSAALLLAATCLSGCDSAAGSEHGWSGATTSTGRTAPCRTPDKWKLEQYADATDDEKQCYTNSSDNVHTDGSGYLVISANKVAGNCADGWYRFITSARLTTKGLAELGARPVRDPRQDADRCRHLAGVLGDG